MGLFGFSFLDYFNCDIAINCSQWNQGQLECINPGAFGIFSSIIYSPFDVHNIMQQQDYKCGVFYKKLWVYFLMDLMGLLPSLWEPISPCLFQPALLHPFWYEALHENTTNCFNKWFVLFLFSEYLSISESLYKVLDSSNDNTVEKQVCEAVITELEEILNLSSHLDPTS